MGFAQQLNKLPHPPLSLLMKPVHAIPWELRNRPLALALNKAFAHPLAEGDLEALEGHWLHICVTDLTLDFYLTVNNDTIMLSGPRPCDVKISGGSRDFLVMAARREDPDTLFFHRRLCIEGNTELGLAVKNMLDAIEFEQLPVVVQWAIKRLDSLNQTFSR